MDKNIKNIKFVEIDSSLEGTKEFVVTYDYEGKPVKDFIFVNKKAGLKQSDYLKIAKKEFKPNRKTVKGGLKSSPLALKVVAGCALAAAVTLGGLFTWKMLANNPGGDTPDPTIPEYTVKWVDEDGTLMDEEVYKEGEIPAYKGEYHDKAGIFKNDGEEYMHFQEGWKEELVPIKKDTTFHAVYSDRLMVTTFEAEITEEDLEMYTGELPIGFGFEGTVNHIDWGDTHSTDDDSHQSYHFYTQPGTYSIKVYGNVQNIYSEFMEPDQPEVPNKEGDYCITSVKWGCTIANDPQIGYFGPMFGKLKSWTISSAVTDLNLFGPTGDIPVELKFDVNSRCRYIKKMDPYMYISSFTVPNTVLEIRAESFSNMESLQHIEFEENSKCSYIGYSAFSECDLLEEFELPSSVIEIGMRAFYGCNILNKFTIPANSKLEIIGESAFEYTRNIKSIRLPGSLKRIKNAAFSNANFTEEIIFEPNDNNVIIEEKAFSYCNGLKKVVFPASFTFEYSSNPSSPFSNAIIDDVTFLEGAKKVPDYLFMNAEFNGDVKFPKSLTEIGSDSFYNSKFGTKQIDLTDTNIEKISENAFSETQLLESVAFPSSLKQLGERSFDAVETLKSVTFPENSKIKKFDNFAFANCYDLATVKLPQSLTELGDGAFEYDKSLQSFSAKELPNLSTIPCRCFNGCETLSTIELNDKITDICDEAFADCSLSTIKLPSSLRVIGGYAFDGNNNLTMVDLTSFTNTNPLSLPNVYSEYSFPSETKFKVANAEMKDAFMSSLGWSVFDDSRFIVA